MKTIKKFPKVTVEGDSYNIGFQHGLKLKALIRKNIELYFNHWQTNMGLDKKSVLNETMKLAPVIEKYDSDILKELAGVANGSGASLEEILAINSRYELIWLKEVEYKERKECTSCGVLPESTSSHHTLIGENWDVKPDMIVMAKAIASGLPLGALLAKKELMETWDLGAHGTTFGGNPLSCAAGLASLDIIIENELAKNAEKIGNHILNRLKDMAEEHRLIGGVRGKGLMIGAELVKDRKD